MVAAGNAVNRMIEEGIRGVEFVAVTPMHRLLCGIRFTSAEVLGAGASPEVGKKAAEDSRRRVGLHLLALIWSSLHW